MSKPSAPPAPDYSGAAAAQGAANVEAARASAKLSNANYTGPMGSRTVAYGGDVGTPRDPNNGYDPDRVYVTESLTPAGQQLFDVNQQTQLGLGNLANQGISQVQGALGQPFDFQGPDQVQSLSQGSFAGGPSPTTNGAPNVSQYTQDVSRAPNPTTSADGSISPTTSAGPLNPSGGQIQSGLNFSGAPSLPQSSFTGQNDPVTQAIIQRNQPFADRQRQQMETQLANQGIAVGHEAWKNAQDDFGRQQNDFNLAAIQAGAQQQNQLFGQQLAARQQGVGEIGQQGQFANLAQQQGYGQALNNAQLNLGAQQQAFGQQIGADQAALSRQQQAYSQGLAGAGLNLGAEQQAYGQQLGNAQLGLGAEQQQYGQQAQTAQMGNQALQAALAQEQSAGQFQNQARQQALQEQAYLRGLPLNQVSALMSGSQVQMPQFQAYQGSQVTPPPIFGATQAQGQNAMQNYGIKQGAYNSMMGGLFGLGAAGILA